MRKRRGYILGVKERKSDRNISRTTEKRWVLRERGEEPREG
jgi:hypothetical protein